jgi:hypothetical protein
MNTLCFYNSGSLDPKAFTMLGLSAKSDDTAIGYFGTGFKYAIAVLLRSGAKFWIKSGKMQYDFSIKKDSFRDKEFDAIVCTTNNGEQFILPFAAHLGANWKMWQVYRELYTNCVIDEKGGVKLGTSCDADVCIFVESLELMKAHAQHDTFFIPPSTTTLAETALMRCLPKVKDSNDVVYYRSMYTGTKMDKPTRFTYDYKKKINLTEDRTIADVWYIKSHISDVWLNMSYAMLVDNLSLIADKDFYESQLETPYETPPQAFMDACKYLVEHRRSIPLWAHTAYTKAVPFGEKALQVQLSRLNQKKLERALMILQHHNCLIDADKLVVCASLPNDLMGMYKNNTIYLARSLFDKGDTMILGTLYEEWLHETEHCNDLTRTMQNLLVDKVANLMEEAYENAQA